MTNKRYTYIPKRQKCINKEDPYVTGAEDIVDDTLGKPQSQVNNEILTEIGADNVPNSIKGRVKGLENQVGEGGTVDERIEAAVAPKANSSDVYAKTETYNKTELNNMITTPNQKYVTVTATSQTTSATDVLPATGEADTVYRVGNWDSSQFDASVYSEYAWNGNQYVHLSTKTKIGEVFDISAYHATGGTLATYADLSAALDSNNGGGVPQSLKRGGMSVKFVQTSDNKYVQYRLVSQTFSANAYKWELYNPINTSDQYLSDLDFSDENGNILVRFQDGNIKTKNFDSSKNATEAERGLMSAEDKTKLNAIEEGAEVNDVTTSNQQNSDLDISDEQGNVIARFSGGEFQTKNFDSAKTPTQTEDNGIAEFQIADSEGNVIAEFQGGHFRTKEFDSRTGSFPYKPYQRRTSFSYDVDCGLTVPKDFSTADSINNYIPKSLYKDNAVLYLPTLYTKDGEPTKLIIYCKHGSSMVEPSSDPVTGSDDSNVFYYLLYLGYAILAVDGVPNDYAAQIGICERAVGNYIAIQSVRVAYNYVITNYNVDKNGSYIYGYSQGGHYAQNVIDISGINILAAAEVSPVCSMRYHQWDLSASGTIDGVSYTKLARLNIARIFDFPAVANNTELLALEYDPAKTVGYDPWNRNVENMFTGFEKNASDLWVLPNSTSLADITMKKHIRCPLKIWCAENDNALGVDVMKVFIQAAKNAGCVADMHLFSAGAHNIQGSQTSIGTFVESGSTRNLYPLAYEIALWYMRFGGYQLK